MDLKQLYITISQFVDRYLDRKSPLLVAVSGGADSLALLHLLHETYGLEIAVAHVDHNWRSNSAVEALELKEMVENLGLVFHLKTLDASSLPGNLENACRDERYQFFRELCDNFDYQGVAVGHHADDQVETVLKRFLEGASLLRLSGMAAEKDINGVRVFRPLLNISKKDLEEVVAKLSLVPFYDETNEDSRFLRGRMRTVLFPGIQAQFGKNIRPGILHIAEEADELVDYLDQQIKSLFSELVEGEGCFSIPLKIIQLQSRIIIRHFVRRICDRLGVVFSRDQLETVCDLVYKGAANKRVITKEAEIAVARMDSEKNLVIKLNT